MSVTIQLPTPLRVFAGGDEEVEVEAGTVGEALAALTDRHPDLRRHLFTTDGTLRSFVNVFLGDEDVRGLGGPAAEVVAGDSLMIIPAIAGGRR